MNYNRVMIGGNLTRDPEVRNTTSGHVVCSFGVAVNQKRGEKEETLFLDCTAWGKTGEAIHKHFVKGKAIFFEGRLQLDQWQDQQGNNRSKVKAVVDSFRFVGAPEPAHSSTGSQSHDFSDFKF